MKFLDEVKIYLKAGDGGDGSAAMRREKFLEFGGPAGGDGGRGGDIILRAVPNLNTLVDYRYQQHFKAERGENGKGKDRYGRGGKDLILTVPIGTQIFADDHKTLLADLTKADAEWLAVKGGRGGLGNLHFKSPTNRAPRQFTKGQKGMELWVWLNLKLIADIGCIGEPNAGKSTLLSVLSAARPKIADYPFTTLIPQLGIVVGKEFGLADVNVVLADLPGLIKGAAVGVGLGIKFLAHAERCAGLLHVVSAEHDNPTEHYHMIRQELAKHHEQYNAIADRGAPESGGLGDKAGDKMDDRAAKQLTMSLAEKPEIVVLSKIDLLPESEWQKKLTALKNNLMAKPKSKTQPTTIMAVSAKTGMGLQPLVLALQELMMNKP